MTLLRWTVLEDPECVACMLPGGYRDREGDVHRDVVLAPMTGREEDMLAERIGTTPMPILVTALLTSCLRRLGPFRPVPPDIVRELLVADRAFLLLKLRHLVFGERVLTVLGCPACERPMDVPFSLDQVPVESGHPTGPIEPFELLESADGPRDGAGHGTVQVRLPTGADQETLATMPGGMTEEQAVITLLARCLLRMDGLEPLDEHTAVAIDPATRQQIEERMERNSPSVDLDLDVTCPECGHAFVQPLDPASLLFSEIQLRRTQLQREVHVLALHYHWPLSEILALTRGRRRAYLALLRDAGLGEALARAGAVA